MYLKVVSNEDALNLDKHIKDGDWMVLYYAEWCGHCNAMKPEWQQVVEKLKCSGNVNIADVKSDVIKQLEHKPQIEGFPTIKMYNNGQEIAKFEDERSAEKIEKFVINNTTSSNKVARKNNNVNNTARKSKRKNIKIIRLSGNNHIKPPSRRLLLKEIKNEILNSHSRGPIPRASRMVIENNNIGMGMEPEAEPVKQITMEELQEMPKVKEAVLELPPSVNMVSKHKPASREIIPPLAYYNSINVTKLPCNEIRRAKPCKKNPKCEFDYTLFKCNDKIPRQYNRSKNIHTKRNQNKNIITPNKSHKKKRSKKNNSQPILDPSSLQSGNNTNIVIANNQS